MKTKKFIGLVILIGLISGVPLWKGCGGATDTGNPTLGFTFFATQSLLGSICEKLTTCFNVLNFSDCDTGVRNTTNIDTEIGLAPGDFNTYQQVITAEVNGDVTPDFDATFSCTATLDSLACNSAEVLASFDPNDASNFDAVVNLLSQEAGSCIDIF